MSEKLTQIYLGNKSRKSSGSSLLSKVTPRPLRSSKSKTGLERNLKLYLKTYLVKAPSEVSVESNNFFVTEEDSMSDTISEQSHQSLSDYQKGRSFNSISEKKIIFDLV